MTADPILGKLDGVQGRGPRWRAICPAHPTKHKTRTLSIFEADDGRVLLHCHAGCSVEAIVGAVGLELCDLFPPHADDQHREPRIKKPWRASDVLAALKHELHIAFVILADVGAGNHINMMDRKRAGIARARIAALILELDHAH